MEEKNNIKELYPYEYTVTDPCYLLDHERWQKCCEYAEQAAKQNDNGNWDEDIFSSEVEKAIREISGGYVFACGTGFGDWTNSIYKSYDRNDSVRIITSGFGADAGMVCVVEMTDALNKYLREEYKDNSSDIGAFFRTKERGVNVMTEGNDNWTVLRIMAKTGATILTQDDYADEEEEDDYYYEDEE